MSTLPAAAEPADHVRADGVSADDRRRAAAVLVAVAGPARRRGVPVEDLLLWRLAGGAAPGRHAAGRVGADLPDDDPAGLVGAALERATDAGRRRAHGLHVTPSWLAGDLVGLALPAPGAAPAGRAAVCDPACGGGAFLVAAARLLHERGVDRRRIVRDLVWGADIDPVGVAAAEAALALWAGEVPPPGRLVVADALREGPAAWPGRPAGGFAAVVGNPPFQNQLGRATARSDDDRRRLRARYGEAVRAYTDTAWLFLLLGLDLVAPGGRVAMVEPQSVIAARDAEAVRRAVASRSDLADLWLDDGRVFSAAVRVCAPVVQRHAVAPTLAADPVGGGEWSRAWARALDLPAVAVEPPGEGGTLGDRAVVVAGFRDQYYGLAGTVRELADLPPGAPVAPLVTSGAVDWAACTWGERPVRYAKAAWRAPVVDPGRLAAAPAIARRWVERTAAPKLVVATQTRVVEAGVDVEGRWVPSVPALAVVPVEPDDLWALAAAVLAPATSAWLAHRSAGTALDRGALRVAGPDLAALPLPVDGEAWGEAADALRDHAAAPGPEALDRYLAAATRAYRSTPAVTAWWRGRAGTAVRPPARDG